MRRENWFQTVFKIQPCPILFPLLIIVLTVLCEAHYEPILENTFGASMETGEKIILAPVGRPKWAQILPIWTPQMCWLGPLCFLVASVLGFSRFNAIFKDNFHTE